MKCPPYLFHGIDALARSLADELVLEAAQALKESAGQNSDIESPAPAVRNTLKQAFSRVYLEDRNRLAVATERMKHGAPLKLFSVAKGDPQTELSKHLNQYLSVALESTAKLSPVSRSPKPATESQIFKILLPRLSGEKALTTRSDPMSPPATLKIKNERIRCIEETNGLGSDEISLATLLVDPIGAVHQFGPMPIGSYDTGNQRTDPFDIAIVNLGGAAESLKWPRTYTVIFTLAEIDCGGFGDKIAELVEAIRAHVQSKVSEYISSVIMGAVGAELAADIAVALGLSGNLLVPGLGFIVGAAVGWVVGWAFGQLCNAIKIWVQDDVFLPWTDTLTLYNPGELWNGKNISDPWGFWVRGHGGHYELLYRWQVDWGTSLGQSSASPQSMASSNPGRVQSLAYLGNDGSVSCFWAGNEWAHNLIDDTGAMSDPFTYIANKDGVNYYVSVFQDEAFGISRRFAKEPSSGYYFRGLRPTVGNGAMLAAGRPWAYIYHNAECIAYRGLDGHIHQVWESKRINLLSIWAYKSPSKEAQAPQAAGDPCGQVVNNGTVQTIYYRGTDQKIHQLWAGQIWKHVDVSAWAQAPPAAGEPHAYLLRNKTQHLCFQDIDGQIWVCWWTDSAWVKRSPTIESKAPIAAGNPFAIVSPDGIFQSIVYRGIDGHIYQLWAGDEWKLSMPTKAAGTPFAAGNPAAYYVGNTFHVSYLGVDGRYYVVWWAASQWNWKNISQIAGGARPAA